MRIYSNHQSRRGKTRIHALKSLPGQDLLSFLMREAVKFLRSSFIHG